jgi:hypothetical protein
MRHLILLNNKIATIPRPKKYKIFVEWSIQKEITVEARNVDEAEEKAMEVIPLEGFFRSMSKIEETQ